MAAVGAFVVAAWLLPPGVLMGGGPVGLLTPAGAVAAVLTSWVAGASICLVLFGCVAWLTDGPA